MKHYIPHIDGLRAVAVLSVVIYHAFPQSLSGGFVGVDIFFVISGYLITRILWGDLSENRFSLLKFYERRVKRIFPALIVVILCTYIFGWFILLESEFQNLNKHILGGAAFASNIISWFEAGYFDVESRYKLLLHLWSLGVEEQFYLFIPLFMWGFRKHLLYVFSALFFASFIYSLYLIESDITAAFYNPLARAWELLAGSILALINKRLKGEIWSIIGMGLIIFAVIRFEKYMYFPGGWALFPVVGASLILASHENAFINRVLSQKIMVWVGLISYPLYLWHWVILSYLQVIWQEMPPQQWRLAGVILATLLAWLTYKFIEKRGKALHLVAIMGVIVIIAALNFQPRMKIAGSEKIFDAKNGFNFPADGTQRYGARALNYYIIPSKQKGKTVYIGDSTVQHYIPRIKHVIESAPDKYNSAIFATMGGCAPIAGYGYVANNTVGNCMAHFDAALKIAKQPDVTTVVFGAHWIAQFLENDFEMTMSFDNALASFGKQIKDLAKTKKVYVITASPVHNSFHPLRSIVGSRFNELRVDSPPPPVSQASFYESYAPLHKKLVTIVEAAGGTILDPLTAFCANGLCPAVDEKGEHLYADEYHLRGKTVINKAQFMDVTLQP
jgi:peptidoglycan/LPS O-acetylase OafA/YrhL